MRSSGLATACVSEAVNVCNGRSTGFSLVRTKGQRSAQFRDDRCVGVRQGFALGQ